MPSVTPPQVPKTTAGVPPAGASLMVRLVPDVRHGPNGRTSLDRRLKHAQFLHVFYARKCLVWTENHASAPADYEQCSPRKRSPSWRSVPVHPYIPTSVAALQQLHRTPPGDELLVRLGGRVGVT